jgi:hypothetical protein
MSGVSKLRSRLHGKGVQSCVLAEMRGRTGHERMNEDEWSLMSRRRPPRLCGRHAKGKDICAAGSGKNGTLSIISSHNSRSARAWGIRRAAARC